MTRMQRDGTWVVVAGLGREDVLWERVEKLCLRPNN